MRAMQGRRLSIVRPSIIESTLRSPAPGWLEGVKVADAVILAYARGRTSFFPARPEGIIDVIPADLVANAILLAAAEALAAPAGHRIYQCCSGSSNPILVGDLIRLLQRSASATGSSTTSCSTRSRSTTSGWSGTSASGWRWPAWRWARWPGAACAAWPGSRARPRRWKSCAPRACWRSPSPSMPSRATASTTPACWRWRGASARRERELYPVDAGLIDWEDYLCRVHMAGLNRYALKRKEARAAQPPARPPAAARAAAARSRELAARLAFN
jgi:fatty acyl-CoA reductase